MIPSVLDPLSLLAIRYGSDKFGSHLYTPVYHDLFQSLRDKPLRMLEIGIGGFDLPQAGGSSLRMWADYFPHAQIVGLDIHPKTLDISRRVHTICGSQADPVILNNLTQKFGPFDIIIDDGSHRAEDAKISLSHLYPAMAAGGIYVIEDLQTSFAGSHDGNRRGIDSLFDALHRLSLVMHHQEGYIPQPEDAWLLPMEKITASITILRNLAVLRRGDNGYPTVLEMDFSRPDVGAVYRLLEEQATINPTTGNYLTRIDMNIWGKRTDLAAQLAMQGAARFAHDIPFLTELARLMLWAARPVEVEFLRQKIINRPH